MACLRLTCKPTPPIAGGWLASALLAGWRGGWLRLLLVRVLTVVLVVAGCGLRVGLVVYACSRHWLCSSTGSTGWLPGDRDGWA
tara:strand:- start:430 stop:681 length:252 start_codon:yes stop_codon:yes gene_type:complete